MVIPVSVKIEVKKGITKTHGVGVVVARPGPISEKPNSASPCEQF